MYMGFIKPEKLEQPLKRAELLDSEAAYMIMANKISNDYLEDPSSVVQEEVIFVRKSAIEDKELLKGDHTINMFIEINKLKRENQQLEQELKKNMLIGKRWENGKRMKITDELICAILRYDKQEKKNIEAFCKENRITRNRYYSIINLSIKNDDDRQRILKCKNSLETR